MPMWWAPPFPGGQPANQKIKPTPRAKVWWQQVSKFAPLKKSCLDFFFNLDGKLFFWGARAVELLSFQGVKVTSNFRKFQFVFRNWHWSVVVDQFATTFLGDSKIKHSKAVGCLAGTLRFTVEWILTIKISKCNQRNFRILPKSTRVDVGWTNNHSSRYFFEAFLGHRYGHKQDDTCLSGALHVPWSGSEM